MRIAQVIKAKNLTEGLRVLVFDAEGNPSWNRVVAVNEEYGSGYFNIELEGVRGLHDIDGRARVVVQK